jgi:hypothetical protein
VLNGLRAVADAGRWAGLRALCLKDRKMKKLIASAVSVAFVSLCWAATPELYVLEMKDARADDGSVVTRTFREVERRSTSSIVDLVTETGSSVSSFAFVLRGMCGVARARGEQYFTGRTLSRSPIRMEIIFQNTAPDPASFGRLESEPGKEKVFSMAECDLLESSVQDAIYPCLLCGSIAAPQ